MSELNLSPLETTRTYKLEGKSDSQVMPIEAGLIEAFQLTSEVDFEEFGRMKESSIDPLFVLAQKRTFTQYRSLQDLVITDFKMPLVKRAKFYKEQTVKDFMKQTNHKFEKIQEELQEQKTINQKIHEELQEQKKVNQTTREKLKEQERINQKIQEELQEQKSINQKIHEELQEQKKVNQTTQEKLKQQERTNQNVQEKLQEQENKICFLEDCFAIHNKRFIFEKKFARNTCETERKVLDLVIEVMAEHEVHSIASDSQSMIDFLNLLRGRLEGLIQVSVDVEARSILSLMGVKDLQQTGYRRVEFAKALSEFLFKSCSQNLAQ